MSKLNGRTAIVTGAAKGLGRAIAEELSQQGANIAVVDIDLDAARVAASEIAATGVAARPYQVDVSESADVNRTFAAINQDFGRIDILVNNAGVSFVGPHIEDTTDEAWNRTIGVMQTGVFFGMRAASSYLLPQRSGVIVNISSVRGFSPNPGRVAYCAAKAAVIMMTKVAAGEWGPYGIRVNAIAPGVQRTPMWEADVKLGAVNEPLILATNPAGRLGEPWEVGRLAAYLCGDDAQYINGACIAIDGGMTSVPADGTIIRPE